jgi:broad specificity phosphatase PhoE
MNIYLSRHGETSWNGQERLQGIRDIPLNHTGVEQSRRLARWVRKSGTTRIITSPLRRARHTAEILNEHAARPVLVDDQLREIDHGPWTGMRLRAIERRFPAQFFAWRFSPEKFRLPAAESLETVYARCTCFLSDLVAASHTGDVLVVSHGVIHALLLCAALGASLDRLRDFSPPNAAVSALRVEQRNIIAVEREIPVGH